jgi:hypothetical protein
MFYFFFVVLIGVLGIAIYLTVVLRAVPGAVDERLGKLEDLPANLGEWVDEGEQSLEGISGTVLRERRVILEPSKGLFGRETLVEQVRYRDGKGGKIVRIDPERSWARRRTRV